MRRPIGNRDIYNFSKPALPLPLNTKPIDSLEKLEEV